MNIKNREVYDLASELARLTGQSMTTVVLDALRRQRKQLQQQQQRENKVQELMAIAKCCAVPIQQPVTALEHRDMLYDKRGLPQ